MGLTARSNVAADEWEIETGCWDAEQRHRDRDDRWPQRRPAGAVVDIAAQEVLATAAETEQALVEISADRGSPDMP